MEVSGWYNAGHPKSQSKMVNSGDMHTILGFIGNVTSFLLFISPLPRIWEFWKNKEELIIHESYDSHIPDISVIYCIMWVLYSMPFVHPQSILITTSNSVGVFIYVFYHIIFFLIFKLERRSMVAEYIAEFVFLAGLTWITLEAFDSHSTRAGFVGFLILCFLWDHTLCFGSHIHGQLLYFLFRFLNRVGWSAYALIKFYIYILVITLFILSVINSIG